MAYRLQDIIDVTTIQELLQCFYGVIKTSIAIVDKDATVVATMGGRKACSQFHPRNTDSNEKYVHIYSRFFEPIGNGQAGVAYQCPHGVTAIVLPIKVNGNCIANFIISQFFREQPNTHCYEMLASKHCLNTQANLTVINNILVLSEELQWEIEIFKKFCDVLSGMAEQRIKEKQTEEKLREFREQLKQFQDEGVGQLSQNEGQHMEYQDSICAHDWKGFDTANIKTLAGAVQDTILYKPMEKALHTNREHLSQALRLAHLGPWNYNTKTSVFEFGDEFYAIYGTDVAREGPCMAPDVYIREFVYPDDISIVKEEIDKFLSSKGHYSNMFEHRIIRRDGQVRTINVWEHVIRDDSDNIVKYYGANQDITDKKAMEDDLQTSRGNLSLAAQLAHLGPWKYDLATNLFEFNDEFYAIYGTDVAQEGRFMAPDVYIRDFVHPDDISIIESETNKALSSKGFFSDMIEHRIIRRDGQIRTINVWMHIIRNESDNIVKYYGANQDITEQKVMEEALQTSRENLSMAAQLAHLGPWKHDLDTNIFEFSDEFYAIYGTSVAREGRFMTADVYAREFVHPDDAWVVQETIDMVRLFKGRFYSDQLEHRIIRRDGQVRTITVRLHVIRDAAGKIVKNYGANQDITERILAENALRESEERNNATLNALPDMLLRINIAGELLDYRVPDRYCYYLVNLADKYNTIDDMLPISLAREIKETIRSSVTLGETQINKYSGQINGGLCSCEIRIAIINKNEVLVIIQDQTEIYRARREFLRLDRLNLIGEMAANIGHEVRNPLTTVRGYLQFLSLKEQFKGYLEMFGVMITELDRSNSIITEFLALSKDKLVNLELKNLNNIITTIYPLLEVEAKAGNKSICLELDVNIPQICLDENEIRQLIINLVRNGLEAMMGNGKLIIKTIKDNLNVMLLVRDNGPGIPESAIDKIGTPFVTTKENGTGLGLSVCYSIAARHNAKIDFTTSKDGTEFTVRFKSRGSRGH
ncbi:MAG: sensor signal transduction histidine kinase [Firmicutes bacterium]|nr:sensor signal transduction histidine kinase [Bacillota bacterium]